MMVGVSLREGVVMEVPCLLISVLVGWFVSGLVAFDEGDGAPDGFFVDAFFGGVGADHGASSGVDGDVVVVVWVSPEEEVAGLGLGDGLLNLLPVAKVGHIGLYRDHETHNPVFYYCKLPEDINHRMVIITDPMLATGGSASDAIKMLKEKGCTNIRLMCLVAAPEGVRRVQADHPDVDIYTASLDERLNDSAYILPGLGDAGDRIFGTK